LPDIRLPIVLHEIYLLAEPVVAKGDLLVLLVAVGCVLLGNQ
jgi:hypothetical protein